MGLIDTLRREYPGDDAWVSFVSTFSAGWQKRTDKEQLLEIIPREELASVLSWMMDSHAIAWYQQPNPALEGRVPKEVFDSEPDGQRILRSLLMRMPT